MTNKVPSDAPGNPSKLVRFGKTDLYVSRLCQGTAFRSAPDLSSKLRAIDRCIDSGVNFFDSSNAYGYGDAETTLGKGIKGKRESIIICTKVHPFNPPFTEGATPTEAQFTCEFLFEQVDACLRRLGTDHVDLYLLHNPDGATPFEDLAGSMDDLVQTGKIRYWGVSNHCGRQIQELDSIADKNRGANVSGAECYYNIAGVSTLNTVMLSKWDVHPTISAGSSRIRWLENDTLPVLRSRGIGMLAYSPMDQGYLSLTPPSDFAAKDVSPHAEGGSETPLKKLIHTIDSVSKDLGVSRAELCYGWVIAHPEVTSVLGGPETPVEIDQAVSGANMDLSSDVMAALNDASHAFSNAQGI